MYFGVYFGIGGVLYSVRGAGDRNSAVGAALSVYSFFPCILSRGNKIGDGPNTVSESTVSNTELSEFFGPHRAPGRELSEFPSAYY